MKNISNGPKDQMEQNRQFATTVGDMVEVLYGEVMPLPLSDIAKHAMVMIMISSLMKSQGKNVSFHPPTSKMMIGT